VEQGQSLIVPIPPTLDPDGDFYEILVDLGLAEEFAIFDNG